MSRGDFDVQGFARDIHRLLVLSTLREEGKHGYQIAMDVEDDSNGLVQFRHGTLYPILHRLEGEGLIRGSWSKGRGRRKKVYSLTRPGRKYLQGESHRVRGIMSRLQNLLQMPEEVPS